MNEKEKQDFYIAMCKCCLIAQGMKSCAVCRFKIGLVEQEMPINARAIPMLVPAQISVQIASAIQQVALNTQVGGTGSQNTTV